MNCVNYYDFVLSLHRHCGTFSLVVLQIKINTDRKGSSVAQDCVCVRVRVQGCVCMCVSLNGFSCQKVYIIYTHILPSH